MNICPKCKSKNIKSLTNVDFTVVAFGANATFKCLDCGFEGEIFPEVDDDRGEGKGENRREGEKKKDSKKSQSI